MKNKLRKELNFSLRDILFAFSDLGKYDRFVIVDHGFSVHVQMNCPGEN